MSIKTHNLSATATQSEETNHSVKTRVLELYDLAVKNPIALTSLVNLSGANNQKYDDSKITSNTCSVKDQEFVGFADFTNWGNFENWRG